MATSEVRTQIYLPRRLHQSLRRAAKARGVSMAQLIREAAEEALRRTDTPQQDPLADLVGVIRDAPHDLAEGHDDYLYGSPRRRR
jgi:predicted DNA-binding ribbon-helix-helix protein